MRRLMQELPNTEIVQTTVGRVLLFQALPKWSLSYIGLIKTPSVAT